MIDLAEFLLARIAEDEQVIRLTTNNGKINAVGGVIAEAAGDVYSAPRLLAECEAKRRIVELHDGMHRCPSRPGSPSLSGRPCDTVLLLALPYAGHPDYREEWRL